MIGLLFPRVRSALRRTVRIAVERPRAGVWTLLALTAALAMVGVALIAASSVDRWAAARPGANATMIVYLGEGTSTARATELVGALRTLPGVERAQLVSPDESAKRLVQALGTDASLLEGIDPGALPASVEATLAPGVRDVVAMSPTVRELRGATGVTDVVVENAAEDKIAGALGTIRAVAWGGAGLFGGLALLIVLAAIRVRLDRGGDELAVAHLLGAGPGFLAIPTALAGALSGLLAALAAAAVLGGLLRVYGGGLATTLAVPMFAPALVQLLLFLGLGAALGLVGGGLAGASRVAS